MKYLMPTHLTNGFTHCYIEPENIIERIRFWFLVTFHKDKFSPEKEKGNRGGRFCMVNTKWFNENVKVSDCHGGWLND